MGLFSYTREQMVCMCVHPIEADTGRLHTVDHEPGAPSLPPGVGPLKSHANPTARTLRHAPSAPSAPIGSRAARAARESSLRHERRDVGRELGLHGRDGVVLAACDAHHGAAVERLDAVRGLRPRSSHLS